MAKYLLDTNVVLRFSNPSDEQHNLVTEAVATLLRQSDECYLTAQVLIELWVVATRPSDVNGLGWSIEKTCSIIDQLLERFPLIEDSPAILTNWLSLVTKHQIKGKRTHDARIVAVMKAADIGYLLTLNPDDFSGILGIQVIHPSEIIESETEITEIHP
jgi:predicted nucleic acid-binding protein